MYFTNNIYNIYVYGYHYNMSNDYNVRIKQFIIYAFRLLI